MWHLSRLTNACALNRHNFTHTCCTYAHKVLAGGLPPLSRDHIAQDPAVHREASDRERRRCQECLRGKRGGGRLHVHPAGPEEQRWVSGWVKLWTHGSRDGTAFTWTEKWRQYSFDLFNPWLESAPMRSFWMGGIQRSEARVAQLAISNQWLDSVAWTSSLMLGWLYVSKNILNNLKSTQIFSTFVTRSSMYVFSYQKQSPKNCQSSNVDGVRSLVTIFSLVSLDKKDQNYPRGWNPLETCPLRTWITMDDGTGRICRGFWSLESSVTGLLRGGVQLPAPGWVGVWSDDQEQITIAIRLPAGRLKERHHSQSKYALTQQALCEL